MFREIDLEQVALNLEAAVSDVQEHHAQLIVVHHGKRVMAMVPIEVYERWIAERDKAFQYFDEAPTQPALYPDEEVHEDIERAIAEVRAKDNLR